MFAYGTINSLQQSLCTYGKISQNTGSKPATEGTAEQSPWHTTDIDVVNNNLIPESVYLTQLRAECKSDAVFKIAGGEMFSRIASNWFKPAGSGFMAYLFKADGSSASSRQTLASLASTPADYGGPLDAIMSGNHQGNDVPANKGVPIQADVADACDIPAGYTPAIGAIWPEVDLAS